jgi:signal transduction histidine kinase/streptogramin lyase
VVRCSGVVRRAFHATIGGMRRICLGMLLCCLALAARAGDPGAPEFQRIDDGGAVPDRVVTALLQDQAGFLWIGTAGGLLRYDGYRFRNHLPRRDDPGSISGSLIRSLLLARDGRIWIGTDADGVSVYDPLNETFVRHRHDPQREDSLTSGSIFALAEAADGGIWIGSAGGGLDYLPPQGTGFVHHRRAAGLTDEHINALRVDHRGDLWVGTWNGLLRRRAGGSRFEPVLSSAGEPLAGMTVYSLFEAADGQLWVGTRQGRVLRIDPETLAASQVAGAELADSAGTASVFAIAQPLPDEIWLARAGGLDVRDAATGQLHWNLRHDPALRGSLGGNDLRALLVDRAGVVWTGGFGSGLQRHDPGARGIVVRRAEPAPSELLAEANVTAVTQLDDGQIWLGLRGGGVAILDAAMRVVGGFVPREGVAGALDVGWITALAQTPDGAVWLGSRDGVRRYDPGSGRFTAYHGERGLNSESIRRMWVDRRGELWIATRDGLYHYRRDRDRLQPVDSREGPGATGDVNAIVDAADGTLWVGAARGLYTLAPGADQLQPVRAAPGQALAHPSILGLLLDRAGTLWLDTPEGLHQARRADGDAWAFRQVSAELGIGGTDFGANLLEDARGRIWTHRFVLDPQRREVYRLTPADGVDFGTGWYRAYTRLRDGRLLFGGSEGLLVVDSKRFRPWSHAPPLVPTDLRVDGVARPIAATRPEVLLMPPQRGFSIEFAALDYSAPERNRYAYRLHGYDHDWIETDAGYRVASYGNLWPGQYRLEIRGSNRAGAFTTAPLVIPVRVLPAFWQTGWAALLAAAALLLLGVGAVRWRTRVIQLRARGLERLIDERTRELASAKARAEQALEQLVGAKAQLVQAEKMASLGQLVAGVAHEVNTPIGIALTAASHLHDVVREADAQIAAARFTRSDFERWRSTTHEAMRLITSSLDRASKLISAFKQVAVDQSSEQRRAFDLAAFLEEVMDALRPTYRRVLNRVDVDCAAGIRMDTYPGALFQVFTNLITNAVVHAFCEGAEASLRVSVQEVGGTVCMRVRDNGVGMSAEVAARAFDPFFTTRRGSGGSGLGLHLVYNIVTQLLGGSISLHTAPGQGCEFVITLPREAPRPAAAT